MKISHFWTFVLTAIVVAGCATKQIPPTSPDAAGYFAQDFTCQSADAVDVGLATLEHAPERYAGKCVRVTAFVKDAHLYDDAAAAADPANGHIALALNDKALERRLRLGPTFAALTARLRLCSRRKAMAALMPNPPAITTCQSAVAALYVSQASIVPTAMD